MDKLHGYRPFTYSRGHSFDRAVPDVAYGEYTGKVGLEQERLSFKWPPLWPLAVSYQVRARQYEASFVALDDICEPLGSGQRASVTRLKVISESDSEEDQQRGVSA